MVDETPETEQPTSAEDETSSSDTPEVKQPTSAGDETTSSETPAGEAAEEAIDKAQQAAESIATETADLDSDTEAIKLPDFEAPGEDGEDKSSNLGLLHDVDLNVKIELGRTRMYIEDVLRLNENSVIELDKAAGDPVDVYVNGRHVARGEVLVLNENFCVRISEIIQPAEAGD